LLESGGTKSETLIRNAQEHVKKCIWIAGSVFVTLVMPYRRDILDKMLIEGSLSSA